MSAIQFWEFRPIVEGQNKKPKYRETAIPGHEAAKILEVSYLDLVKAFNQWGQEEQPGEFYYKTEEQPEDHEVYIYINPYRGLNSKNPGFKGWGHVSKARSWGRSYRGISRDIRFSQEILVSPDISIIPDILQSLNTHLNRLNKIENHLRGKQNKPL